MSNSTLTTLQEVLFDLYDARDSGVLQWREGEETPEEFESVEEWLNEQIMKIESIEAAITK